MFYVGGDYANSNIELHDIRFSVGKTAQSCYDDLRKQWWGKPRSLHIDSWAEIDHADGYDVSISPAPFKGHEKLYFLNLGGYNKIDFEEVHKNLLAVEMTSRDAVQKSLRGLKEWLQPHKDTILDVEKVISLSELMATEGLFIHLKKSDVNKGLSFTVRYIKLNK